MKPDKPTPPSSSSKRDRDILRSRNSRSLKTTATNIVTPSVLPPLSAAEASADDGTEPSSSASTSEDIGASSTSPGASSSSSSSSGEKDKGAEMKLYLDKLRELVPYVPRSGRISRVQLIHSAIDYITDLQESLEARARRKLRDKQDQAPRPPLAALSQAHVETNSRITPLAENSSNRQPTLLETNTRHPSALAASPPEGSNASSNINLPLGNNDSSNTGSHSTPLISGAAGPPSPQEPS